MAKPQQHTLYYSIAFIFSHRHPWCALPPVSIKGFQKDVFFDSHWITGKQQVCEWCLKHSWRVCPFWERRLLVVALWKHCCLCVRIKAALCEIALWDIVVFQKAVRSGFPQPFPGVHTLWRLLNLPPCVRSLKTSRSVACLIVSMDNSLTYTCHIAHWPFSLWPCTAAPWHTPRFSNPLTIAPWDTLLLPAPCTVIPSRVCVCVWCY